MLRTAATAALAALAVAAPAAGAVTPCVFAEPAFLPEHADLRGGGALGLVVPDAGPTTSEARARTWLARGEVRNSLRGSPPRAAPRIRTDCAARRIVVGVPVGGTQPNDRRYGIFARGHARGVLTSDSTRIPGLVSIADVARGRLESRRHPDPVEYLERLDARIAGNGRARVPAAAVAAALLAALALLRPAAAVLGFSTALAANLGLGIAEVSKPWAVVALIALATAAAVPLSLVLGMPLRLAGASVAVVVAYGVAMAIDATWVALSPLGPSQNGRFFGLSNLLATLLLVPALTAAAVGARRLGWWAFAGVAVVAIAVVASSRLGADGGGAIVLAAGYAALAALRVPRERRVRALAAVAVAAAAVVAAAVVVGPATHVTEAIAGGPSAFAGEFADRIRLSWLRATESWIVAAAVTASLVALAVLVARGPRTPLALAFAFAVAVSMVVNDSPREVAVGGLVGYLAVARLRYDSMT